MRAVGAAHTALAEAIASGELGRLEPLPQDRSLQLRYSRGAEFTDDVAAAYLARLATPGQIEQALAARDDARFSRPRYR